MLGKLLMALGRIYPFVRGRTRFILTCVFRKPLENALALLPNPQPMRGGFSLYTHPREYTSLWLRMWGVIEEDTRDEILKSLPPDSALLDVGANLGIFSVGVAHRRPDVTVYAVEPNPRTAALLRQSVRHNHLEERVHLHEAALADCTGEISFFDNPENAGDSHIVNENAAMPAESILVRVPVYALDQFHDLLADIKSGGKRVACLKMDIQGPEVLALRGMKNFLAEHRPVIIVEATADSLYRFGFDEAGLRKELESQGYTINRRVGLNLVASPVAS